MKIIIKKNKNNKILVLVKKHKIKDLIGFFSLTKNILDLKYLTNKSSNGVKFSNSSKNLIYKYYYSNILGDLSKVNFK